VSIIYNYGLPAFDLTIENPKRFEKPTKLHYLVWS
jgi:hypothetical protein